MEDSLKQKATTRRWKGLREEHGFSQGTVAQPIIPATQKADAGGLQIKNTQFQNKQTTTTNTWILG
jgi:hypothetical protein